MYGNVTFRATGDSDISLLYSLEMYPKKKPNTSLFLITGFYICVCHRLMWNIHIFGFCHASVIQTEKKPSDRCLYLISFIAFNGLLCHFWTRNFHKKPGADADTPLDSITYSWLWHFLDLKHVSISSTDVQIEISQ